MAKGILTQSNYTLVNKSVIKSEVGGNLSIASTVPDYANFKKVESETEYLLVSLQLSLQDARLNSTEAAFATPEATPGKPGYMTPTASATNRMFK